MPRRQTNDAPRMEFESWDMKLDYKDLKNPGLLTSMDNNEQQALVPGPGVDDLFKEIKSADEEIFYFGERPNRAYATKQYMGNLKNIFFTMVNSPDVSQKWNALVREMSTRPLPMGAAGWRFEVTYKMINPNPEATPPGFDWICVASRTSAEGHKKEWAMAIELRKEVTV